MSTRLLAHRIRIYPTAEQSLLLLRTFGCCRLLYNLALEQRSTFHRPGRRIYFRSWSDELKALKAEAPFLAEVPHHCLVQALKDLDHAFSRFFSGQNAYPQPRKKFGNESCRFPDPKQFRLGKESLFLPKLGHVQARVHRPIQGELRSVTVNRDGNQWYASILVRVRAKPAPVRTVVEGGYDIGVQQPVVDSDGTVHQLPRVSQAEQDLVKRVQRTIARRHKGSRRREKAKARLRNLQARFTRRRRNAAHQVSCRLVDKYSHLAAENLELGNMTASARGTVDKPGRNVAQKAGLNRSLLDIAPGQLRRMVAYKAGWAGTVFTCVDPSRTSQTCSDCGSHPKDEPDTAHIPHGRVSRDRFECPLCGFAADADVNAARNIRARGRLQWSAHQTTTAGPAVAARGALPAGGGCEAGTKISSPGGRSWAA